MLSQAYAEKKSLEEISRERAEVIHRRLALAVGQSAS
jgi:hypothetical protein